jgi:hypothetical protein
VDKVLERLAEQCEMEAYMIHAANNYLLLVLKFLQISQHEFSPSVTRAAMDLSDAIADEKTPISDTWSRYIELIKASKQDGMDLSEVPLKAFGHTIY